MSNKISGWEPAPDRPYQVELSVAEVHALIKHHISQTRRCTKFVGNKLLKLQAGSAFPKKREADAYIEEGRKIVAAHISRAKGLQSFLKS